MIHHDRLPYLYHWFNHLTSLAFHIAFGAYLHVEIVRSQRPWKVDVLAWSFVLLACVIAVISSWAKPWCGMTWYLLVYTISAINTRKKKLWIAQLLAFRSNARDPERISVSEPILVLHFTTLINANPCMIWCHSWVAVFCNALLQTAAVHWGHSAHTVIHEITAVHC